MDFEGFDWTEISKYFSIIEDDYHGGKDEEVIKKTKDYLKSYLMTGKENEVTIALRAFTEKLYEKSLDFKCNAPIWKGLLDIKDDFTFLKYAIILFDQMWV